MGAWVVLVVLVGVAGVALRPRGYVKTWLVWSPPGAMVNGQFGTVSQTRITRWQLLPPAWTGLNTYPWWTTRETAPGLSGGSQMIPSRSTMTCVLVEADCKGWWGNNGGCVAGWGETGPGAPLVVNGQVVTLENAGRVIDAVSRTYCEDRGGIEFER